MASSNRHDLLSRETYDAQSMAAPSNDFSNSRSVASLIAVAVVGFALSFGGAFALAQRADSTTPALETEVTVSVDATVPLELPDSVSTTSEPANDEPTTTEAPPTEPTPTEPALTQPQQTQPPQTDPPLTAPPPTEPVVAVREPSRPNLSAAGSSLGALDFEARRATACENVEDCQDNISTNGGVWAWTTSGGSIELLDRSGVEGEEIWTPRFGGSGEGRASVLVADVTGDGESDFIVGRRTATALQVDVVDVASGSASVVLHLDLDAGRVRLDGGGLIAFQGVYVGNDPSGDPSRFDQWTIRGGGPGGFNLVDSVDVSRDEALPSQL